MRILVYTNVPSEFEMDVDDDLSDRGIRDQVEKEVNNRIDPYWEKVEEEDEEEEEEDEELEDEVEDTDDTDDEA